MNILPTVKINNFTNIWDFKPEDVVVTSNNKLLPKYKFEIAV
jgi:thymidylate synthase